MKVISQDTFDSVVLEGVNDFDNPLEVAIEDAIKEFEAQGVQLSNIVKNMRISDDNQEIIHDVVISIETINKYNQEESTGMDESAIIDALQTLTAECKLSLGHRVLANSHNAYLALITFLENIQNNSSLLESGLKAIMSLMVLNPDMLDPRGAALMMQLMDEWQMKDDGTRVPEYLVGWSQQSCVKHEMNRQNLVLNKSQARVLALMDGHKNDARIVKVSAKALRAFMLDDDIRKDFSKAHDHARQLVEDHNGIPVFLEMTKQWLHDETADEVVYELLCTLSRLCVKAEYCQMVVDNGGLVVINDILSTYPKIANLNKVAILLLKSISGNDTVKEAAMKSGAPRMVVISLDAHQSNAGVCEAGCSAIAMLALRVQTNAKQLMEMGAAQVVIQAMKIHPNNVQIQKFGCMAIRNLVTRIPENQAILVENNAEDVVQMALNSHGVAVRDHAMAALRDLGADVKLIEQWKGTGHEIDR